MSAGVLTRERVGVVTPTGIRPSGALAPRRRRFVADLTDPASAAAVLSWTCAHAATLGADVTVVSVVHPLVWAVGADWCAVPDAPSCTPSCAGSYPSSALGQPALDAVRAWQRELVRDALDGCTAAVVDRFVVLAGGHRKVLERVASDAQLLVVARAAGRRWRRSPWAACARRVRCAVVEVAAADPADEVGGGPGR